MIKSELNEIITEEERAINKIEFCADTVYNKNLFIKHESGIDIGQEGHGDFDNKMVKVQFNRKRSVSPQKDQFIITSKLSKGLLEVD